MPVRHMASLGSLFIHRMGQEHYVMINTTQGSQGLLEMSVKATLQTEVKSTAIMKPISRNSSLSWGAPSWRYLVAHS